MSILTLNRVSYSYPGTKKAVLKDINAEFEPGKLYAIVGKSGAGKSTLLSLMAGLEQTPKGNISFDGQNLKDLDRDDYRARSIGVIFQGYNLLTNATAIDNLVLSMGISSVKGNRRQHAYELLTRVGIDRETANRPVLKLSGGEQQRVGIARALAHDPQVIIADEPSGNLDSETEASIMSTLQQLAHEQGKCVIIVTHSKSISRQADEVWGLNQGSLNFVR
jgi:putative ABC transport system ATP-binding protein